MIRRAITFGIVAGLLPVCALAARDPDWPCQQIKVPELSLASVWSGPVIDPADTAWKSDPAVAELVGRLARRREPIDQAEKLIQDFAQRKADNRQPQLSQLMAGVFTVLSDERGSVLAGLDRFGKRQKELAAEVRADNGKLQTLQSDRAADPNATQLLVQKVMLEAEVFQDRSRALSYACDVPSKIEQRLFALARQIQHELE